MPKALTAHNGAAQTCRRLIFAPSRSDSHAQTRLPASHQRKYHHHHQHTHTGQKRLFPTQLPRLHAQAQPHTRHVSPTRSAQIPTRTFASCQRHLTQAGKETSSVDAVKSDATEAGDKSAADQAPSRNVRRRAAATGDAERALALRMLHTWLGHARHLASEESIRGTAEKGPDAVAGPRPGARDLGGDADALARRAAKRRRHMEEAADREEGIKSKRRPILRKDRDRSEGPVGGGFAGRVGKGSGGGRSEKAGTSGGKRLNERSTRRVKGEKKS